jgi:hypothetical protein
MANLELKKFDIDSIADDSVVIYCGSRRNGKSVSVKDVLYHKRDIPIGTIVSPTEFANKSFGYIVPSIFIHEEVTNELIDNVIKRQKNVIERMHKGETNIDPRAFLILDDCLYDSAWTKSKGIRTLFYNGRHYHLLLMITMQYCMGIPPSFRTNIDYTFIYRDNNLSNRKRIYENFAGMFPTFDVFCQVMDQCTENYECLVINNSARTNKLNEQVFWYKSPLRADNFKVGAPEAWKFSEKQEEEEGSEDEDDFDPSIYRKQSKGPNLNVKKKS